MEIQLKKVALYQNTHLYYLGVQTNIKDDFLRFKNLR